MTCGRCDGFMFEDHFMDMNDLSEGMWATTWRCINCSHTVDPVMTANRERQTLHRATQEEVVHQNNAEMPWTFSEIESPCEGVTMMIRPQCNMETGNDCCILGDL